MSAEYQCLDCGRFSAREEIVRVQDIDYSCRDAILTNAWHYSCAKCGGRIILLALS